MNMINRIRNTLLGGALFFSLLVVSSGATAQQYKQLTRMGTSEAVCPAGIQSLQQLQQFFTENSPAIRSILNDSQWAGDADALFAAVAAGDVMDGAYPVGTKMAWMGANTKGTYVAKPYRQWAGSKSFAAFQINVSSGCEVYEIAIPKQCCNISLISVSPDNSSECTSPNAAAGLGAGTETAGSEQAATDASKSAVGAIVPFIGAFAASEKRPRFETAWAMDMIDTAQLVGLRAGLLRNVSDRLALFGQLSAYNRSGISEGNVYPDNNIALDIGIQRTLTERLFIGAGLGVWNIDDSGFNDGSLFATVGGDVGKSNFQWYLEGRVFESDSSNHDSLSDNKMLSIGLRYLIK